MAVTQNGLVYAQGDVRFVCGIAVAEQEYDGIRCQQCERNVQKVPVVDEDCHQGNGAVADGYSLEHCHDAQMSKRPVAADCISQPVDGQSYEENQDSSLGYLPCRPQ